MILKNGMTRRDWFRSLPSWMRHAIGDEMWSQEMSDPDMLDHLTYGERIARAYRALTSAQ